MQRRNGAEARRRCGGGAVDGAVRGGGAVGSLGGVGLARTGRGREGQGGPHVRVRRPAGRGALFGPCSRPRGAGVRRVLSLANEACMRRGGAISEERPHAANLKQGRAACGMRHVVVQQCGGAEARVLRACCGRVVGVL